jgi:phosphatidylglycerol:prolipoprotein diacylglycerol transferase
MIHWNVNPEIFHIGIISIRYYSLLFMLSFIVGIYIFQWVYKRENKPKEALDPLLIYMLLGTVIGARLGHCLFYDASYYLSHPIKIFKVWEGGLASHGAAIGILLSLYLFSRKHPEQPFLWLVDRIVITVALAGSFIRLGNLFNSEIIGKPADVPWSFVFERVDNIPRHPTQIYESVAYFIIFVILFRIYKKYGSATPRGYLLGLFLVLVFGFRFFVEFLKENQVAFESGMALNMGQILSIPAVIGGMILIYYSLKSKNIENNNPENELKNKPKKKS